jgi:hypothetical protein
VSQTPAQPLDYASTSIKNGGRWLFKSVLATCALLGATTNLWFVTLTVSALHSAIWAHHDLTQNNRAFGREASPQVIAALAHPTSLHIAAFAFVTASIVGVLLAVELLLMTWQLDRTPDLAAHRATNYHLLKPLGTLFTAVTLFWFFRENQLFWQWATRHIPVGSMPPYIQAALVLACGMFPWWWLNKGRTQ